MLADDVILVSGDVTDRELINLCQAKPFDGGSLDLTKFVSGCISRRGKLRRELAYLKPLIRRDFVERHGLRYDETLRLGEDYAFYTKALIAGARFHLAGACGYVAVERANSLSNRWTLTDLQSMLAFDDHVLAGCAQLTKQERSVFTAHRRNFACMVDYMAVADRMQQRGRLAALAMLPQMPSSASYILLRTALDKLVALPAKLGVQRTENRPGKTRLVIGMAPRKR
jgi:succinoglycan biosynthesis protein ExoU